MEKDLSNYRRSYEKQELLKKDVPDNPMELFQKWFYEVDSSANQDEANAMTLTTFGLDGYPKARVVLLKKFTFEGFIFYTNYQSEKGRAISKNANVCLNSSPWIERFRGPRRCGTPPKNVPYKPQSE